MLSPRTNQARSQFYPNALEGTITVRRSLQLLFAECSQQFFRNNLAGWKVKWAYLPGNLRGRCDKPTRTIKIKRGLRGDDLRRTLLHEMCHCKALGHGKRFQARLRKLETSGETWVDAEIEGYKRANSLSRPGMVKDEIETAAMSDESDLTWRKAKLWIAHELGYTSVDFGKAVPWAEGMWRRKRQEYLELEELDRKLRQTMEAKG